MAHVLGTIFLDEDDEIASRVRDGDNPAVWIRLGQLEIFVFPKHLELLRRLATATAEAERDLEAIVARAGEAA